MQFSEPVMPPLLGRDGWRGSQGKETLDGNVTGVTIANAQTGPVFNNVIIQFMGSATAARYKIVLSHLVGHK